MILFDEDPVTVEVAPPPTSGAPQLWGAPLERLFPIRRGSPRPLAVTPWPQAAHHGDGPFDRDQVAAALSRPPPPSTFDPRHLWCSQGGLTWEGVEHYLNHDIYALVGTTWADQDKVGNLRPVIYLRTAPRGRQAIILSGHHRAAAALLAGRPLLGIAVEAP